MPPLNFFTVSRARSMRPMRSRTSSTRVSRSLPPSPYAAPQ